MSKRDGDKMGFPVFPLQWTSPTGEVSHGYREDGYFPEAFINMLALLGWNPGTEQEIFSMEELIEQFSLDRVSKSGARFNPDKARWFNAQYMHVRDNDELADAYLPLLREHGVEISHEQAARIAGYIKSRATFVSDFWDLSYFLFNAPKTFDQKVADKYWKGDNPAHIAGLRDVLAGIDDFANQHTEAICHAWIEEHGYKMGQIMNAFRLAIVGESKGFSMYEMCEVLGKEETLRRLDYALATLPPREA